MGMLELVASLVNLTASLVTTHYNDVTMGSMASQITSLTIVYSVVYSGADQRKHQSSASLAFVRGIHRGPVNFPHKWPVTRKMFPLDDVIMQQNVTMFQSYAHSLCLQSVFPVPVSLMRTWTWACIVSSNLIKFKSTVWYNEIMGVPQLHFHHIQLLDCFFVKIVVKYT